MTIRALKLRETLAQRKADTGCSCHGKPVLECPDYRPQYWIIAGIRHKPAHFTRLDVPSR